MMIDEAPVSCLRDERVRPRCAAQPRTDAYQQALENNPALVKGKVVLDVGCGTGILSLFACRAGAARVISVEGNQRMAGFAQQVSDSRCLASDTHRTVCT